MEEYFIGSGAILEAGERSKITGASLHAQLVSDCRPSAVLVDFEGGSLLEVRRLLALVSGFSVGRFEATVSTRLLAAGACGFDDVVRILAEGSDVSEVHLYARWVPDESVLSGLAARGVTLQVHPLEEISRAALIAEHRFQIWGGGLKAA